MRKFKHKPSGFLYDYREGNMYAYSSIESKGKGSVPLDIILSGNDWEEIKTGLVKPQEWEITAYEINGNIFYLRSNGQYGKNGEFNNTGYLSESMINKGGDAFIYSVRMLSDGVEFKISDTTEWGKISGFTKTGYAQFYEQAILIALLHKREKLFTTEDGVDIYSDTEYWSIEVENSGIVDEDATIAGINYTPKYNGKWYVRKWDSYPVATDKRFSTKEAAEEYILMNKPCLSINDIKDVVPNMEKSWCEHNKHLKLLIEIVKSKLK